MASYSAPCLLYLGKPCSKRGAMVYRNLCDIQLFRGVSNV